MTWNVLHDIKLRKLEYRMRNADELRFVALERLNQFTERHGKEDWQDIRPVAMEVLIESEAVMDEAVAISLELQMLPIPRDHAKAQADSLRIANHADLLVEKLKPIRNTMRWVIEAEDKNGPSGQG